MITHNVVYFDPVPPTPLLEILTRAVVPNHWAMDWYWSVGRLVPGRRERINILFYFCYIDDHTWKVVLF